MKRLTLAAVILLLAATATPEFRFHRPLETHAGWNELQVPDDVFEAARAGLGDVRIFSSVGAEIPYAIDDQVGAAPARLPLINVETVSSKETTALVDRGEHPGFIGSVRLDVTEAEYIKPVVIEGSTDRATWSQIAHGSIFSLEASPSASTTRLTFAPNDSRYLRFHLDDRNGPAVHPTGVVVTPATPQKERRLLPATLKPESDAEASVSTFTVLLPSAHLPIDAVRLTVDDPAFSRRARVYERVWFRDEVSRRLLGEGELVRTAAGHETTNVPITEPQGKVLELDVERTSGLPLHVSGVAVSVAPRSLLFFAPDGANLELRYGSSAAAPTYDLAAALSKGRPQGTSHASLGPAVDTGTGTLASAPLARGATLDPNAWRTRQAISLPSHGPVAYLDLDRGDRTLSDVRIVNDRGEQIPYLVESTPRHFREGLAFQVEHTHPQTIVMLTGLKTQGSIDALELEVPSPDFFSRDTDVVEDLVDARGKTGELTLGSARLVRASDAPHAPLRIAIAQPTRPTVAVRIADGDNAPLVVAAVNAEMARRRINFVFSPGDNLQLLTDNAEVSAPRYELALVAERVLGAPAEAATLGEVSQRPATTSSTPRWFWAFVLGAALVLAFALVRTLRPA